MIAFLKRKKIALLRPTDQKLLLLARAFYGMLAIEYTNFAIKYIELVIINLIILVQLETQI